MLHPRCACAHGTSAAAQVKKEQDELERAFGSGTKLKLPGKIAMLAQKQAGGEVEKATIMVYGDDDKAAWAQELLLECVDNKDQKQKQRQKVRFWNTTSWFLGNCCRTKCCTCLRLRS